MYWKIQLLFCKSILWCQIRLPSTDKFRYSVLTKCSNSKYFWFEGDCGVIATLTWITFDISHGSTSYDIPCHSGNTCWHDTNTFGIWGTNTYKYTTQEIQFTIRCVTKSKDHSHFELCLGCIAFNTHTKLSICHGLQYKYEKYEIEKCKHARQFISADVSSDRRNMSVLIRGASDAEIDMTRGVLSDFVLLSVFLCLCHVHLYELPRWR